MKTRIFPALIFFVFVFGTVSAEEDAWNDAPKNVLSFDIGAAAVSLFVTGTMNSILDDYSLYYIASAIHYERELTKNWSVEGRIGYIGYFTPESDSYMSSISGEGHFRYYPSGGIFFLGGMLGYTNFTMKIPQSAAVMSHYFTAGGKLGWRIDFGSPGGLVLEPSLGLRGIIHGKTNVNFDSGMGDVDGIINIMYAYMANYFNAGPYVSLLLGYRF